MMHCTKKLSVSLMADALSLTLRQEQWQINTSGFSITRDGLHGELLLYLFPSISDFKTVLDAKFSPTREFLLTQIAPNEIVLSPPPTTTTPIFAYSAHSYPPFLTLPTHHPSRTVFYLSGSAFSTRVVLLSPTKSAARAAGHPLPRAFSAPTGSPRQRLSRLLSLRALQALQAGEQLPTATRFLTDKHGLGRLSEPPPPPIAVRARCLPTTHSSRRRKSSSTRWWPPRWHASR